MQKKIFRAFAVILLTLLTSVLILSLGSCSGSSLTSVEGTGAMVSRNFSLELESEDFTALNFNGPYNIIWQQGSNISFAAEMQENLFEYFEVSVNNGTLYAEFSRPVAIRGSNNTPRIYITSPQLTAATFSGAVDTAVWDTIYAEQFDLNISGAGNISLSFEVDRLDLTASGASDITLSGNADTIIIESSGVGSISAEYLQTRDANLNISGVGNANIAVSDNLDVTLSGVGNVRYRGDPAVTQNISGLGSVTRME